MAPHDRSSLRATRCESAPRAGRGAVRARWRSMGISTAPGAMTGDEIVALTKRHTLFEWSAQTQGRPDPGRRRQGRLLLDARGQALPRLQQPADVHEHRPWRSEGRSRPSSEQAETLAYANPFMATEPRARLGREAGRDHARRHRHVLLHERRRGGERERDQAGPIRHRAPQDPGPLPRRTTAAPPARSRLTGDPRRWAAEPGIPGVVRVLDPYHGIQRGWDTADEALANLEEMIQLEGPNTIAAFILETVVGTNGILVPPDGYIAGRPRDLRPLRDPA